MPTVDLNGYFKVSDFHSILQTFFLGTTHIIVSSTKLTLYSLKPNKTLLYF